MFQNKDRRIERRKAKVISLSLAFGVAVSLLMAFIPATEAAPVTTTISVYDKNGFVSLAKVAVFNARNGKQISSGLTDSRTGLFTFRSRKRVDLIVAVHSTTGYVGGAGVTPGEVATIMATQQAGAMPTIAARCVSGRHSCEPPNTQQTASMPNLAIYEPDVDTGAYPKSAPTLDPSSTAMAAQHDSSKKAMLTLLDGTGSPIVRARIAIVEWATFEQVEHGHTNKKGQFTFEVPEGMESDDFMAVLWSENGDISLVAALQDDTSPSGGGGEAGWPAF